MGNSEFFNREMFIRRREELGWSQSKLSTLSGLNQSIISRFERGENVPTFSAYCTLASTLGYQVAVTAWSADVWRKKFE